jgi:hypothetical protein
MRAPSLSAFFAILSVALLTLGALSVDSFGGPPPVAGMCGDACKACTKPGTVCDPKQGEEDKCDQTCYCQQDLSCKQ